MIGIEDTTSNILHDLGCLLLGGEFFNGDFARDEGNDIGDRVQLKEAIDGQNELEKAGLLPPRGVGDGLIFWGGGGNLVFTNVNCLGDHSKGGCQVIYCGGIVLSTGTRNDAGDCGVGGRHGGASVPVGGAFKCGRR